MELSTEQQVFETLNRAKRVVIALPEVLTADSAASGLGLAMFLRKLDKEVELVSSGRLPDNLKFLPQAEAVKSDVSADKGLVVVVDTLRKELEEISYQKEGSQVKIFLKSKNDLFKPEDVSFASDQVPVDVIITLDCRSLEDLGRLFERHPDLFFEIPKINIDHRADNEYFGSINMVDAAATSVAEVLAGLLEKYEASLLDEDIATCLLAGIITKTNSFQHAQTTPKAFLKASQLISLGGRQQEVVKNLLKTKSLPVLKLWGRALARLKNEESLSLIYSLINFNDFVKSGAITEDLAAVLKEIISNVSAYDFIGLIGETSETEVRLILAFKPQYDLERLRNLFGGRGSEMFLHSGAYRFLEVRMEGMALPEAEARLVETIKSISLSA